MKSNKDSQWSHIETNQQECSLRMKYHFIKLEKNCFLMSIQLALDWLPLVTCLALLPTSWLCVSKLELLIGSSHEWTTSTKQWLESNAVTCMCVCVWRWRLCESTCAWITCPTVTNSTVLLFTATSLSLDHLFVHYLNFPSLSVYLTLSFPWDQTTYFSSQDLCLSRLALIIHTNMQRC